MRKFGSYSTSSTSSQMADLTAELIKNNSIQLFLQQFDFESEEDVAKAIRRCYECIIADAYLRSDEVRKNNPILLAFYNRYKKHYTNISFEGYAENTAKQMWLSFFAKRQRDEQLIRLTAEEPKKALYMDAEAQLKDIYKFSDADILKFRLFVVQSLKGRFFPDSLRRMLYLYSEKKKTGKTTFARILAEVLNGWKQYEDTNIFNSQLSIEMQIANYAVPKVAQYNCVVLDECFYSDMAKTYARFKEVITSRDGEGRLPYGQPFRWEGVRNYIATSNEALSSFIVDWNDRRYYNINFTTEPKQMKEEVLFTLIRQFVQNVEREGYEEIIRENYDNMEVEGARTITTNDYETEMRQDDFCNYIADMRADFEKKYSVANRLTLKKIVEYFASQKGGQNATKERKEIERAFVRVFGEKTSGGYWLLTDVKIKIAHLQDEHNEDEQKKLPF